MFYGRTETIIRKGDLQMKQTIRVFIWTKKNDKGNERKLINDFLICRGEHLSYINPEGKK